MPRDVDDRKKRKALRKIRKAALLAEQGLGPPLSDWEKQFLEEVEARIETYGSAFRDLDKGASDEALSALQQVKLREIDKKARGKGRSGFQSKRGFKRKLVPRERQIDADIEANEPDPPKPFKVIDSAPAKPTRRAADPKPRPQLRIIKGGANPD
ncbi:MAG: hypothetical protein AAGA72_11170 [Pseudomonadota bacterium]